MSRFTTMGGSVEGFYVYDNLMTRGVPMTSGLSQDAASAITASLNQRVERPELTRADGKLVSV